MTTITIERDSVLDDKARFESDKDLLEFLISRFTDHTMLVNIDEESLNDEERLAYQRHQSNESRDFSDFKRFSIAYFRFNCAGK